MLTTISNKKNVFLLMPSVGIILFLMLYVIATFFYPGGSQVNKNSEGFSWLQNYWCNLLNAKAINGADNPAQPIALVALCLLCGSLIIFWNIFPIQLTFKKRNRTTMQVSGTISMLIAMFLFTNLHDVIINIASLFGFIALAGTFIGLYKKKLIKLFWFGIFNLALIALNNVLYYGNGLIHYLPIVQKITFFFFLLLISLINITLYKKPI